MPAGRGDYEQVRRLRETPLYIERSDEFERVDIDERRDPRERRRRGAFTMQEAERVLRLDIDI